MTMIANIETHVVHKTIKQRIYVHHKLPLILKFLFSFMDKIYVSLDTLETYLSH